MADFLRRVFTAKATSHAPHTTLRYPLRPPEQVRTASQYAAAEDRYLVEEKDQTAS